MEPVTQALLGAATAQLVAGRRLPGRALGWGAVLGMAPDLDVLLGPLNDGYGEWLYHRGTTHSVWFGFVVGPALGWLLWRWRDRERDTPLSAWIALAIVALVTHPLLDGFTPYGTQFFAPFSRERFAWNGVAIVDPFYSAMLVVGVLASTSLRLDERTRKRVLQGSLVLSSLYLMVGVALHRSIVQDLRAGFERQGIEITRLRAYPTIFQPWLRGFVAHAPDAIYVGLHSWREWSCPSWRRHPRPVLDPALTALLGSPQGRLLDWFADGDVGIFEAPSPDAGSARELRIEDLRYSWASAQARGMWGIRARVVDDRIVGPISRISRGELPLRDLARVGRLLSGQLPIAEPGWRRPASCLPNAR